MSRINSIEIEAVCNVTGKVSWYSKTSFYQRVKPKITDDSKVKEHPEVVKAMNEKMECSKYETYFVNVRTSDGQYKWTVEGYRV